MKQKDYRKINLIALSKEVGSLSSLAALAGSSQSYLSQIVGKNSSRDLGDEMARRLEFVCKKPIGWLDEPHIEETKLNKARDIYEILLRFEEPQLDALHTLLGYSGRKDVVFGRAKFNDELAEKKVMKPPNSKKTQSKK